MWHACFSFFLNYFWSDMKGRVCSPSWWGPSPHMVCEPAPGLCSTLYLPLGYAEHNLLVYFLACTSGEKSWVLLCSFKPGVGTTADDTPQALREGALSWISRSDVVDVGVVGAEMVSKVAETHDKNRHCQNPGMSQTNQGSGGFPKKGNKSKVEPRPTTKQSDDPCV